MWKTKFSSHKQYLFELLFPWNANRTHTNPSIPQTFLLCLKRNASQTFKSSSFKKVFPKCVYHWYNLLWWLFFHGVTVRHYFLYKFIVTQSFGASATCCVLCFKRSPHFISVVPTITSEWIKLLLPKCT